MNERMPSSITWASPSGTAPKETINDKKVNLNSLHGNGQEGRDNTLERGIWIEGGGEEDNMRYRNFLAYCEERREEAKRLLEGDEDRKREAKRKK